VQPVTAVSIEMIVARVKFLFIIINPFKLQVHFIDQLALFRHLLFKKLISAPQ